MAGATRLTVAEKDEIARRRSQGQSIVEIHRTPLGTGRTVSRPTIYDVLIEYGLFNRDDTKKKYSSSLPSPKTFKQLDGGVQDLLSDFNAFRVAAFGREPVPWANQVAELAVTWLLDRSEKSYAVENEPPGVGKTTLFAHDLIVFLICGGIVCDTAWGRALRVMLGSDTKNVAIHNVKRIRNTLELTRPYFDRHQGTEAEICLAHEFGRFKPKATLGEEATWRNEQFVVAQIGGLDVYEKEPTVQAASRESGFLGERVDLAVWDDLVTSRNCRSIEQAEALASWFEDEAETRVEPGGLLLLVGQRLGPLDLYRNRIDAAYVDDDGVEHPIYHHVVFPAHNEATCDGNHRQWDGDRDGCLLDERRLSHKDLLRARGKGNYACVYQQEDASADEVLVPAIALDGGTDPDGFVYPGCYDRERAFLEWPETPTFDYVCVDPSASRYWASEWWAYSPDVEEHLLVMGARKRMTAGGAEGFLDFDPTTKTFVGLMEEWQVISGEMGHPIKLWIVEQNAAHRYLFQTIAFKMWLKKWPKVRVIAHSTQKNKNDPNFGVFATLPMMYRSGKARLPRRKARGVEDKTALDALNYLRVKTYELTHYPQAKTDDTIMANWFGFMRADWIAKQAVQSLEPIDTEPDFLPSRLSTRETRSAR